jgi:hypothetical protein
MQQTCSLPTIYYISRGTGSKSKLNKNILLRMESNASSRRRRRPSPKSKSHAHPARGWMTLVYIYVEREMAAWWRRDQAVEGCRWPEERPRLCHGSMRWHRPSLAGSLASLDAFISFTPKRIKWHRRAVPSQDTTASLITDYRMSPRYYCLLNYRLPDELCNVSAPSWLLC